jgi:hypothetical protein
VTRISANMPHGLTAQTANLSEFNGYSRAEPS